MPSRQLVYAMSVMWQHVSTSKGHRQGGGITCIRGNVYSFNYVGCTKSIGPLIGKNTFIYFDV